MQQRMISHERFRPTTWLRVVATLGTAISAAGCGKEAEPVTAYSVPKPPPAVRPKGDSATGKPFSRMMNDVGPASDVATGEQASEPGTMLGAILPRGEDVWFFKLLGPKEAVVSQAVPFLQLVKSLKFQQGRPAWSLPDGWSEQPGNQFRFATFVIENAEVPLEVTVTTLPMAGQDLPGYLLSNINRWRGQLQLEPLPPDQLDKRTIKVDVDGEPAWLVNIDGTYAGDPMRSPSGRPAAPSKGPSTETAAIPPTKLPFTFELPTGWSQKGPGPMRMAEFTIADGDKKAVTSVSSAGGELLANVNRWRGQVKLEPVSRDELEKSLQKLSAGDIQGDYVQLFGKNESGKPEAILGFVVNTVGRQWFIKLQGDADLVKRETERFETFVKSMQFRGAEGGPRGN